MVVLVETSTSSVKPSDVVNQSDDLLSRQNSELPSPLPFTTDTWVSPSLETERKRNWILVRDRSLINYLVGCPEFTKLPNDVDPQLTHILSPRAVIYGLASIALSDGPGFIEDITGVPLESLSSYTQLPDNLFRVLLHRIRQSENHDNEDLTSFFVPTKKERNDLLTTHQGLARRIITDPRNIVGTTRGFNKTYTPLLAVAYQNYLLQEAEAYAQMQRQHDVLAQQGRIGLLVHPSAEVLQAGAIRRTHKQGLESYPQKLHLGEYTRLNYEQIFGMALDRNSEGYISFPTAHEQSLVDEWEMYKQGSDI